MYVFVGFARKKRQASEQVLHGFSLGTIRATWYLYLDTHLILLLMYLCEAFSQYCNDCTSSTTLIACMHQQLELQFAISCICNKLVSVSVSRNQLEVKTSPECASRCGCGYTTCDCYIVRKYSGLMRLQC